MARAYRRGCHRKAFLKTKIHGYSFTAFAAKFRHGPQAASELQFQALHESLPAMPRRLAGRLLILG